MSRYSSSSHSRPNISRDPSTHEKEVKSNAAPERLFKAFVLNGHDLIPKVAGHTVERCEIEGDGGVGTFKMITYSQVTKYRYEKHRIESIDPHNREVSISVIESKELLSEKIEKITFVLKFLPAPGGGTVVKIIHRYHFRAGHDSYDVTEIVEYRHEIDTIIIRAVERHLHENPHAFK